jgi:hypothetical protein
MCTNIIGKGDAMSPQERLRYAEAIGTLPEPTIQPTTNQTSLSIPSDHIALPNGKRVSPDDYKKLQIKLKNRG